MATPKKETAAQETRRVTATELLKGILANPNNTGRALSREAEGAGKSPEDYLADKAATQADALLARLEKEGD